MKMFRLLLASASMLVLLFCGTEASAQADNLSGSAQLNVKQLVQVGDLDLVEKTQALEILSELKDDFSTEEDDLVLAIKHSYNAILISKIAASNESISTVIENSIPDLVRVANRFKDVSSATLSSVYNDIVAELEN